MAFLLLFELLREPNQLSEVRIRRTAPGVVIVADHLQVICEVATGAILVEHFAQLLFEEGSLVSDFDIFVRRLLEVYFELVEIDFAEIQKDPKIFTLLLDLEARS